MENLELWQQLLATVVAGAIVAAAKFLKDLKDSRRVRDYAQAIRDWNEPLYWMAQYLAEAAEEKISDTADRLQERGRYGYVYEGVAAFAEEIAHRAGVKVELSPQQLEAIVRSAIADVRRRRE